MPAPAGIDPATAEVSEGKEGTRFSHSIHMAHKGLASRPVSSRRTAGVSQDDENGSSDMRVLLPMYGSCWDVELLVVPLAPIGVCR